MNILTIVEYLPNTLYLSGSYTYMCCFCLALNLATLYSEDTMYVTLNIRMN